MQGVQLAMAQPRGKTICQGPAFLEEEERKKRTITVFFFSFPLLISKCRGRVWQGLLEGEGPVWGKKNKGLSEFHVAAACSWG